MTIKEYIIKTELTFNETRLKKLLELDAPAILIDNTQNKIDSLKTGILKCGGHKELLSTEFKNSVEKIGNGGKVYFSFNNGTINYFPTARFGRCIYPVTK